MDFYCLIDYFIIIYDVNYYLVLLNWYCYQPHFDFKKYTFKEPYYLKRVSTIRIDPVKLDNGENLVFVFIIQIYFIKKTRNSHLIYIP